MCHFLLVPEYGKEESVRSIALGKPWFGDAIQGRLVGVSGIRGLNTGMQAIIGLNDVCQYNDFGLVSLLTEVSGKCVIATRNRILGVAPNMHFGLTLENFGEHIGLPRIGGQLRVMVYLQASEAWLMQAGLDVLHQYFGFAWIEQFDPQTSGVLFGGNVHANIYAIASHINAADAGAFEYRLGSLKQQIPSSMAYAVIESA